MVVLLISPAPVTVVAVLYADTVLKTAGVDRIQAPSLTATIGEKPVRPPSGEDDETRVRRHEIPLEHARYRLIPTIYHTNGQFSVDGGSKGIKVFKTREEADAYAMQLQTEAGGPDKARIIVHDLLRGRRNDQQPAS